MTKSTCPLCRNGEGFPQTITDQRVVGNAFATSSYTVETQYVFCRDCRVQFEPLITWQAFNEQKRQRQEQIRISKLSDEERNAVEAKKQVDIIQDQILNNWFGVVGIYILALVFTYGTDGYFNTITFGVLALWTGFFVFYLVTRKKKLSLLMEQIGKVEKD